MRTGTLPLSPPFDVDDWIMAGGGGEPGMVTFELDPLGDPLEPVMWWSADGAVWQRIATHPFLDPTVEPRAASRLGAPAGFWRYESQDLLDDLVDAQLGRVDDRGVVGRSQR